MTKLVAIIYGYNSPEYRAMILHRINSALPKPTPKLEVGVKVFHMQRKIYGTVTHILHDGYVIVDTADFKMVHWFAKWVKVIP